MAILHRNPMPLSGALFVTNPRRKKAVRKNRKTRRKNALKMKRNAKHSALYKFLKSKSNPKKRRNGTKKGQIRKTARRAYMKKRKNVAARKVVTSSTGRKMHYVKGKLVSKAKYDAAGKKSTAKKSTAKKTVPARKVVTASNGRKMHYLKGKLVSKAKYDAAGKKSTAKKSTAKKKGGKKVSDWNKFRKKMKGAGLSAKEMRRLYSRYVTGKETMASLTKIKKSVDARSRKIARIGRRTKSRAVSQLKGEKGWLWNPLKKLKVRKNQGIMGVQPLALPLQVVEGVQAKASRLPVVKFVSFAITPLALGAAVYAVHRIAEPHVMKLAEDLKVGKVPVLKETLKFPYTTTGVVAGLALGLLAKAGVLNRNAASMVAASAASVGIALDLSLRPMAQAAEAVVEDQVALADMAQSQDMGALHTNPHCYGDGGQYMIGRNSTALGASHMGAVHMGAVHMGGVHDSEYGDASLADAKMCTCVMMPDEVAAAKAGKDAYIRKFGLAPRNKYRSQSLYSRHAGRAGHRFGWLINMVGFANFQKIAAMPPKQRATVISQLQKQAIASIPQLVAAQQAQHGDIESASIPVDGTINGVQGFGSAHYGALMFAGSGY